VALEGGGGKKPLPRICSAKCNRTHTMITGGVGLWLPYCAFVPFTCGQQYTVRPTLRAWGNRTALVSLLKCARGRALVSWGSRPHDLAVQNVDRSASARLTGSPSAAALNGYRPLVALQRGSGGWPVRGAGWRPLVGLSAGTLCDLVVPSPRFGLAILAFANTAYLAHRRERSFDMFDPARGSPLIRRGFRVRCDTRQCSTRSDLRFGCTGIVPRFCRPDSEIRVQIRVVFATGSPHWAGRGTGLQKSLGLLIRTMRCRQGPAVAAERSTLSYRGATGSADSQGQCRSRFNVWLC